MKFAEHLSAHLTPEWNSQYIRYDDMKDLLAQAIAKAQPFADESDNNLREQFFLRVDEHFFQYCEKEATKINTFFAEKLAEALRRWETLKNEVSHMEQARRHAASHRSGASSADAAPNNEPSDGAKSAANRRHSEDHQASTALTRVLPDRLVEKTREKQSQRVQYRKRNDLKLAFSEFYLMLVLLQNYQTLNFTGFRKILKKHDKLFQTSRGEDWRKLHIDSAPFHTSKRVEQLISEVETMCTETLEAGNRARAMKRLRVPPLEEKQSPAVTFRVGIFVGMICLLLPAVIALGANLHDSQSAKPLAWQKALFLYRSTFLIVLHIILVGINVYGWSSSGVNHILIFEIDPRNHLTYQQFLEIGTCLFVLWFLSFTGFILCSYFDFHPFVQPLAFVILMLLFLFNPTHTFYHHARFWFLKTLGRVICAPFYRVGFADFWLGDQLTSLELIFFDIEYFCWFYIYDVGWWSFDSAAPASNGFLWQGWPQVILQTVLMMLPSWFRFAQCLRRYRDTKQKFPHLVNAGKYASGFFVTGTNAIRRATAIHYPTNPTSNPFLYIWIVASFIGATYKVIWDLKMDWGFFDKNAGENKFLRDQIVYPSRFYYYAAIVENVIFRYIWLINVFMHFHTSSAEYKDVIGFIFGLIEIFRRFIWNYFRLENEHLNNCGEFRAVRDISIAPLSNVVDYGTLEDMMDKDMGIRNRRKAKRHGLLQQTSKQEISNQDTAVAVRSPRTPSNSSNPFIEELNTPSIIRSSPTSLELQIMFDQMETIYLGIGFVLRVFLFFQTKIRNYCEDSGEFVTPLSSWKRVIEGIYLRKLNLSPFTGSIVHETPLSLFFYSKLHTITQGHVEGLFIVADLLTAVLTYKTAQCILTQLFNQQTKEQSTYKEDSKMLWLTKESVQRSAYAVLLCSMVNPFSIGTCLAKSSLVFHNLLLTMTFYFFITYQLYPFVVTLAVASSISLYPIVLIAPALLRFSEKNNRSLLRMLLVIGSFVIVSAGILFLNFTLNRQSWSFLESTYSFIFHVPDYTPNIGIFWYFFTEMFDHFRSLFVWTFQMHVLLLYILPFTIRLRNDSIFLFWLLCALFCTFKSYPAYGDAAFYFNYLPVWSFLFRYVRHGLIIICMILVTVLMAPITWYLWIYTGSANANFYFAMTMVFNVAQTFLVSDLLYAYLKRKFFLKNGLTVPQFNGADGQLEFH